MKYMHSQLFNHYVARENNMENGGGGGIELSIPLCTNRVVIRNVY